MPHTMSAIMNVPQVDVAQLQNRDLAAWTQLLREVLAVDDVVVTAVTAEALRTVANAPYDHPVSRYHLTLENHTDTISFIGKHTNRLEALFYQECDWDFPHLAPPCHYLHLSEKDGWLVLADIPNDFPAEIWTPTHVEQLIEQLADLHTVYWQQTKKLSRLGVPHFVMGEQTSGQELAAQHAIYFDQGPAAVLSDHAIHHAGRLAGTFLKAANGLTVMRSLGGWPGILGESHLTAVADLLDDPVPMLEPLKNLPATLLHGNPHSHHWRLTLFGDSYLLDWHQAMIGPGVLDLVSFVEQFDLLFANGDSSRLLVRQERPLSDETMIDSYLLTMSSRLGSKFDGRALRRAIPAARCLHVLTNWLPHFASWFSQMPNTYTWQKINRLTDAQLAETPYRAIVPFRPYLAGVFHRFLQSYKTL
ncbi:MAG: phosphotransferase [Chloroflexota bacterium]